MSHEKGIEAAKEVYLYTYTDIDFAVEETLYAIIKSYLDVSGMVMVPRQASEKMEVAAVERVKRFHDQRWYSVMPKDLFRLAWPAMIDTAPNPFQTLEESREKK